MPRVIARAICAIAKARLAIVTTHDPARGADDRAGEGGAVPDGRCHAHERVTTRTSMARNAAVRPSTPAVPMRGRSAGGAINPAVTHCAGGSARPATAVTSSDSAA